MKETRCLLPPSCAFLAAAEAILLALIITIIAVRVRRADLGEARP